MALIIYPTTDYDSFISVVDADTIITNNSVQSVTWLALTEAEKEVYLRIATTRILNAVSTDTTNSDGYLDETVYVAVDSCLPKSCALMAVHDLVYGLSSEINPNTGLVTKEKVGDLEVQYAHGFPNKRVSGRVSNPYPSSVRPCLESYGATGLSGGITQVTLERK